MCNVYSMLPITYHNYYWLEWGKCNMCNVYSMLHMTYHNYYWIEWGKPNEGQTVMFYVMKSVLYHLITYNIKLMFTTSPIKIFLPQ